MAVRVGFEPASRVESTQLVDSTKRQIRPKRRIGVRSGYAGAGRVVRLWRKDDLARLREVKKSNLLLRPWSKKKLKP